ncbi:MAG: Ribosomal protein methyltransferase [Micavibrio sp.]|nr:Ribosomal protein methyltransferase [Micavibrio sp.]
MPLYTITTTLTADLDEDQVGRFAEAAGNSALSTSLLRLRDPFHGPWQVQWLFDDGHDRAAAAGDVTLAASLDDIEISTPVLEDLPDTNWLEQSYKQFPPFGIGPFFIHGSHFDGTPEAGKIALQIDAATAFGSGEHGTTSGCLLILDQLKTAGFTPRAILDMGCGSGILAIACRKIWDAPVSAIDIDPESVRVTKNHAAANNVALDARAGAGFAVVDATYDLTIANILPVPLKDMAADLMRTLNEGGYAILSGMLLDQAADVLDVYESLGAKLHTRLDRGEWTALLLQK